MANLIVFCILAVVILGSAIMSVLTKRIMRSATFLLFVLFGIAGIYFLLDYTFLGAVQISIYAGGVTMVYIFAIQLVSKRTLQGLVEQIKGSRVLKGCLLSIVGFVVMAAVLLKSNLMSAMLSTTDTELPMQQIGTALLGSDKYQYVLPFELLEGFFFTLFSIGVSAAETAVALAIIINVYRNFHSDQVNSIENMKF